MYFGLSLSRLGLASAVTGRAVRGQASKSDGGRRKILNDRCALRTVQREPRPVAAIRDSGVGVLVVDSLPTEMSLV